MTGFLNVENETTARHPTDVRYMKMLRFLLRMVCAWPQQLLGEEVTSIPLRNKRILFVEGLVCSIGGLIYVKMYYKKVTFLELGHTYLTIFLSIVTMQRVTIPSFKSYGDMMKEFVLELHLFHHRQKTAFTEYMYQYIHRICTIFVTVVRTQLFFGVILFNLVPLYNNYTKGIFGQVMPPSGKFEHSINYYLPYIHQHSELTGYIFIAIVNSLFSYDAAIFFCGYDLILCVIVFHIWGHLKILNHNLRSIPTPIEMRDQKSGQFGDELSYTKEENTKVADLLKNNILHHRMISSFMSKTSEAFGPTLCLYYMFHQVSGCILLLECSELDAKSLTRYGALTVTLFQLMIQLSVIVELLGSQSETLKDAVYSVPWEYMDTSNRKIVLFLLCNVQEPIRLKPLGLVSVGVQTMATILKTSLSYFMLLKTFT